MALAHFRILIRNIFNKYPYIVQEEAPLTTLDRKSTLFMAKNGKDIKHTRKFSRRIRFVRNSEK